MPSRMLRHALGLISECGSSDLELVYPIRIAKGFGLSISLAGLYGHYFL
jgi:hypothetical protein